MAVTIKKDRILDNWMAIVDNGAGQRERIYTETENLLEEAQPPGVSWKRDDVNTGIFGRGREFIIVSHRALSEYKMFLSARDGLDHSVGHFRPSGSITTGTA